MAQLLLVTDAVARPSSIYLPLHLTRLLATIYAEDQKPQMANAANVIILNRRADEL